MTKAASHAAKKVVTNKEIRREALKKVMMTSDIAAIGTIYVLAAGTFVILAETLIMNLSKMFGFTGYKPLEPEYYTQPSAGAVLIGVRLVLYYVLMMAAAYMVRRYFINLTEGTQTVTRYMSRHVRRLFLPSFLSGVKLMLYKLMLASPLGIGIYGIVHFYRKGVTGEIRMTGLVLFMLSIGFSIVWFGELVHYFLSLSLFKYIIELNPRVNFFDACDLSVKLMEGRHRRLLLFMLSLLPYMLLCVFIYPTAAVYPYVTECRMLLAKEIMGDHWQDKLPAMAKRWEKQQARANNPN